MKVRILCYWVVGLCLLLTSESFAGNDTTRVAKPSTSQRNYVPPASFPNPGKVTPAVFRPALTRSLPQVATNNMVQQAKMQSQKIYAQRYRQIIQSLDSNRIKEAQSIHALKDFIKLDKRLVKTLNINAATQLPVGVEQVIGGVAYTVLVDSISVDSEGNAKLSTFMSLTIPQGDSLAFKGSMTVSSEGGLVGETRLDLLTDVPVRFAKGVLLNIKQDETYVVVDCDGFKKMGLKGELTFANLVRDSVGGIPGKEPIVTSFATTVNSWNDLVVEVNMPDFQIRGIKGLGFRVENAVLDFSDNRNALNFTLPDIYDASWLPDGDPNSALWQGFYVRSFKVALPRYLKAKEGEGNESKQIKGRITILGTDLVLDQTGFTGKVTVDSLITRRQGNMDGFPFSIDHLGFEFRANELTQFDFNGTIGLPVSDEDSDDYLLYRASLDFANDEFFLSAGINKALKMPMFGGRSSMTLSQAFLEVRIAEDKVKPKAILSGHFTIDNSVLNVERIGFEGIEVTNKGIGKFDKIDVTRGKKEAGKFPVQITDIALLSNDALPSTSPDLNEINRMGIKLGLQVNFTEDIAAIGAVTLIANQIEKDNGKRRWKYKQTQFDKMEIDVDKGPYLFKGSLQFFREDPDYGNGFNGNLQMGISLGGGKGFGMRATAVFGNVDGMRYFYADALIAFSPSIPLGPSGIALYGFGGGVYYRMNRVKPYETNVGSEYGKTAAGDIYVPDANTGIGIKATTIIGLPGSLKPFQGEVTFEIAFNRNGGVRTIGFAGYGYFLNTSTKVDDKTLAKAPEDKRNDVPLSAMVKIDYDVPHRTLHVVADVQVSIKKVGMKMKGGGQMTMHFSPQDWYIYLGTPENRIGVELEIAKLLKMKTGLYLMTGTKILAAPPLPDEVRSILKEKAQPVDSRDANQLSTGTAYALGFDLAVTSKFEAFVYLKASLGLGFDVEYRKYKDNVRCKGRSGKIGVNGWFGQGKAYMYAKGALGVKFKKKEFAIAELEAAILAQMQFVNPTWAKATLGGRFKILGGLVKGKFKLKIEFGKHCTLESVGNDPSPVADLQVIAEATPMNNSSEVDVFTVPQVAFNMAVGESFDLLNDDGSKLAFRVKLDKCELNSGGRVLRGTQKWNSDKDVLLFQTRDVLPSKSQVIMVVQISFEERKGGQWVAVTEGGKPITERKKITFITGEAPKYVPLYNIASSYPIMNQLHFHKQETNRGFIQLHQGQAYLFDAAQNPQWASQKLRWTNEATQQTVETDFTYDAAKKRVVFDVNRAKLQNATIYKLSIVSKPPANTQALDANVKNNAKQVITQGDTLTFANKEIEGTQKSYKEQIVLDNRGIYFRTSRYNTMLAKLRTMSVEPAKFAHIDGYVDVLHSNIAHDELFDRVELEGINIERNGYHYKVAPLIRLKARLNDTKWHKEKLNPIVYAGYPYPNNVNINWRTPATMGVPPANALSFTRYGDTYMLDPDNLVYPSIQAPGMRFTHEVAYYASGDFYDFQGRVAGLHSRRVPLSSRLKEFLDDDFPAMRLGDYPIEIRYVLPHHTFKKNLVLKTYHRPTTCSPPSIL